MGEYVVNRLMVQVIRDICSKRGIEFNSLSDDWLIELTKNGVMYRILGYKFSLNDSVASSIAGDKVAAHLLLDKANVPSVQHLLLRPPIDDEQKRPVREWGKVVVKPLDGSGGNGVKLFSDIDEAAEWIESTDHPAWAASPFIDIKHEMRFVLLDQEPLIVYEKQAVMIDSLKMFNLGQGATPNNIVPSAGLITLASRAQAALGLRLSAVDIIETMSGEYRVLEINSGFMMEHYMRSSEENYQKSVEAYEKIIDEVVPK